MYFRTGGVDDIVDVSVCLRSRDVRTDLLLEGKGNRDRSVASLLTLTQVVVIVTLAMPAPNSLWGEGHARGQDDIQTTCEGTRVRICQQGVCCKWGGELVEWMVEEGGI